VDLSVIIVNWNSAPDLARCLSSLYAHTTGVEFEVIVVDNASRDGCGAMLADHFPQVTFVQSTNNRGFAAANNLGVRHSSGSLLLFLNPDTEFTSPAIGRMMSVLESRPDAGIVGCRLLNADGTVQTTCVQTFPTIWNEALDVEYLRRAFPRSRLWGNAVVYSDDELIAEVECISGACLMIRRDVFNAVGGFCERYFMYVEDRDLCYAIRHPGYKTFFTSSCAVIHYGGTSSGLRPESDFATLMRCESLLTFMRFRRGRIYATLFRASVVIVAVGRLLALALLSALGRPHAQRLSIPKRKWRAVLRWSAGLLTPAPAGHAISRPA